MAVTVVVSVMVTVVVSGTVIRCFTFKSGIGIVIVNMLPSTNCGAPPEYKGTYLIRFLNPEPSSSASPISWKNFAIIGFLETGEKLLGSIAPYPFGRFAFSVRTYPFSMISFTVKTFENSLRINRFEQTSQKPLFRMLSLCVPSK